MVPTVVWFLHVIFSRKDYGKHLVLIVGGQSNNKPKICVVTGYTYRVFTIFHIYIPRIQKQFLLYGGKKDHLCGQNSSEEYFEAQARTYYVLNIAWAYCTPKFSPLLVIMKSKQDTSDFFIVVGYCWSLIIFEKLRNGDRQDANLCWTRPVLHFTAPSFLIYSMQP